MNRAALYATHRMPALLLQHADCAAPCAAHRTPALHCRRASRGHRRAPPPGAHAPPRATHRTPALYTAAVHRATTGARYRQQAHAHGPA